MVVFDILILLFTCLPLPSQSPSIPPPGGEFPLNFKVCVLSIPPSTYSSCVHHLPIGSLHMLTKSTLVKVLRYHALDASSVTFHQLIKPPVVTGVWVCMSYTHAPVREVLLNVHSNLVIASYTLTCQSNIPPKVRFYVVPAVNAKFLFSIEINNKQNILFINSSVNNTIIVRIVHSPGLLRH